jgi:hypothetical protein
MTSCVCSKGCGKVLMSTRYLKEHEARCNGLSSLHCECGELFPDRFHKYRHRKTCATAISHDKAAKPIECAAPLVASTPSATASPSIDANVDVQTMNNSVIEANNTNNTTIVINNYCATDIEATIREILRSPAFAQCALETGKLTEAVVQQMHWTGCEENRNVLGIDDRGKHMFVTHNGKRMEIDKKQGLNASIKNATRVANDPALKKVLQPKPAALSKPPFRNPDPIDNYSEYDSLAREQREIHYRLHRNKGEFEHDIVVPYAPPYFADDEEMKAAIMKVVANTKPFHQKVDDYKEPAELFCGRYQYMQGKWFAGTGALRNAKSGEYIRAMERHLTDGYYEPDLPEPASPPHPALEDTSKLGWEVVRDPIMIRGQIADEFKRLLEEMREDIKRIIVSKTDPAEIALRWNHHAVVEMADWAGIAKAAMRKLRGS